MDWTNGELPLRPICKVPPLAGRHHPDALEYRRQEAELLFHQISITFAVYGDAEAQEQLIPFDVIPRICRRRNRAFLGRGLDDGPARSTCSCATSIAGRDILRANIIPDDLIFPEPSTSVPRGKSSTSMPHRRLCPRCRHRHRPSSMRKISTCWRTNVRAPPGVALHCWKTAGSAYGCLPDLLHRAPGLAGPEKYSGANYYRALRWATPFGASVEPTVALILTHPASTIPPITNIPSSLTNSASNWSRGAT